MVNFRGEKESWTAIDVTCESSKSDFGRLCWINDFVVSAFKSCQLQKEYGPISVDQANPSKGNTQSVAKFN